MPSYLMEGGPPRGAAGGGAPQYPPYSFTTKLSIYLSSHPSNLSIYLSNLPTFYLTASLTFMFRFVCGQRQTQIVATNDAQVGGSASPLALTGANQVALWLGTSQGRVLLVGLEMPDNEDNRILQLQSVNAEPIRE